MRKETTKHAAAPAMQRRNPTKRSQRDRAKYLRRRWPRKFRDQMMVALRYGLAPLPRCCVLRSGGESRSRGRR